MPAIVWSAPALEDLRRINDWLAQATEGEVSVRTLSAIRDRATFLERFPHGGRPHWDAVRILRVFGTRYLILYQIESDVVQVLRVHHEPEDWLIAP